MFRGLVCLSTLLLVLSGMPAGAEEREEKPVAQKEFEGKWNNRKYNSDGPLKCIARPGNEGIVLATFSGTYKGDPFTYNVEFQARQGRGQMDLSGKSTIDGHIYEWTGALKGTRLSGKYLGTNGYNGEFILEQTAAR